MTFVNNFQQDGGKKNIFLLVSELVKWKFATSGQPEKNPLGHPLKKFTISHYGKNLRRPWNRD